MDRPCFGPVLLTALLATAVALAVEPARAADEMLRLESDAFAQGAEIPPEHTCDGADRSPPLHWSSVPDKTKAFALVVEDPDAPAGTFTHWIAYNIPDAARALAASVPVKDDLGDGTLQGKNDFGEIGYGGPCPPRGSTHRYVFRFYALSKPLDLEPGATRAEFRAAMQGKILAEAEWTGRYRRTEESTE